MVTHTNFIYHRFRVFLGSEGRLSPTLLTCVVVLKTLVPPCQRVIFHFATAILSDHVHLLVAIASCSLFN